MSVRANAEGWLDMGAGLHRKTHFFEDGRAVCNSRIAWGKDRLQRGANMPSANSCMICLVSWSRRFDDPAPSGEAAEPAPDAATDRDGGEQ